MKDQDRNAGEPPFKVVENDDVARVVREKGLFLVQETENGSVWGRHATEKAAKQQVKALTKALDAGEVPRRPEGI